MNTMNPNVDFYFVKAERWRSELELLRAIVLDCGLTEELKWGVPCYTSEDRNVILIHGFKHYCAIMFMKGALMKDPAGVLFQQTENVQSGRQIRFTGATEITKMKRTLKAYIREAVEVEKAGLKVPLKQTAEYAIPEEFQNKLDAFPALKAAFEALTPGRQRAYILHFSQPKQSRTRESRVEKFMPHILSGKGMHDR